MGEVSHQCEWLASARSLRTCKLATMLVGSLILGVLTTILVVFAVATLLPALLRWPVLTCIHCAF